MKRNQDKPRNRVSVKNLHFIQKIGIRNPVSLARLKDTDTRWQDVPDEWIEYFSDVLSFFDTEGFRYYIPAYMIWSLKNYKTSESNSINTTIYGLLIYKYDQFPDYDPYHRFRLLNREQSKTISNFLNFMATYCEDWADAKAAKRALNQYWHQFLTP